jgi:hypothetical protein
VKSEQIAEERNWGGGSESDCTYYGGGGGEQNSVVLRVPRHCQLVLLIRIVLRWTRMWSVGGMMKGESGST